MSIPPSPPIPDWLKKQDHCTTRQYRQRKRREFKELFKAFHKFWCGVAYCPGKSNWHAGGIYRALESIEREMKGWR